MAKRIRRGIVRKRPLQPPPSALKSKKKTKAKKPIQKIAPCKSVLSDRYIALIDHYFSPDCHFNFSEAMRRVGMSENTVKHRAHIIRKDPRVDTEIKRRFKERQERTEMDADWVLEKLRIILDASLGDIVLKLSQNENDLAALTAEERYALSEVTRETYKQGRGKDAVPVTKLKLKLEAKLTAINQLMRHLGMYNDTLTVKQEITLVERLQRGRQRAMKQVNPPGTIDSQAEEVEIERRTIHHVENQQEEVYDAEWSDVSDNKAA